MSTSFRLRVCIKDEPGALLRMLETLSGYMQDEQEQVTLDKGEVVPDIHMFTLKRCSRFPILYTTNPHIAGSLFLKPHYLFHAIIELKLRRRSEEKTIAVLELHACLITSDYGVKASNFCKFIESLTRPRLSSKDGKELLPLPWRDLRLPDEVIYVGTLSPLSTSEAKEYPETLMQLKNSLQKILVKDKTLETCPERGTCPLGFILHNQDNLRKLYRYKFTRIFLKHQGNTNALEQASPDVSISRIKILSKEPRKHVAYDVYLTFIRDHECYEKNRSFEEYYGFIMPRKNEEYPATETSEKKFTIPFRVNSVVVDVKYVNTELNESYHIGGKDIVHTYIESMLNDIIKKGKEHKDDNEDEEYNKNIDFGEKKTYYIVSKYFTCEDPSCDITRCFMPKLSLPRK